MLPSIWLQVRRLRKEHERLVSSLLEMVGKHREGERLRQERLVVLLYQSIRSLTDHGEGPPTEA